MSSQPSIGTTSPVNPIASPINSAILQANNPVPNSPLNSTGVGGTSGTGANSLSMNLGGLNLNYDLGPSVSTVAQQAEQFVGQSFNADAALLGNTISDTQGWMGAFINPVIQGGANQQAVNAQNLPGLYSTLLSDNLAIGQGSINANIANAQASIASSNASAEESDSGGCFITSAMCEACGLPDDCIELRMLRQFRDTYMRENADRRALIREYYATAPAIVAALACDPHKAQFYKRVRLHYIMPAVHAIIDSRPDEALRIYKALVNYAQLRATDLVSMRAA